MNTKTIITYGTFDLFHVGHLRLLSRLKSLGNRLIIGLSTDEFNSLKGKKTIIPFQHRLEILEGCKYVDKVIPEENWEQKESDIKRENADIFAMGDDWSGKFDYLQKYCNVIYLPRSQDISTTEIKEMIKAQNQEYATMLQNISDNLKKIAQQIR